MARSNGFKLNWPPKKKEVEELTPTTAPERLAFTPEGETSEMLSERMEAYLAQMNAYAQEASLYLSEEQKNVQKLAVIIQKAMQEYEALQDPKEKAKKADTIRHHLFIFNNDYRDDLIEAADKNREKTQQSVPEDQTPQEKRDALRDVVAGASNTPPADEEPKPFIPKRTPAKGSDSVQAGIENIRLNNQIARKKMQDAEAEYLAAYKEYEKNKGTLTSIKERLGMTNDEKEKVAELKEKFDLERVSFAQTLSDSALARIAEGGPKGAISKETGKFARLDTEKVLARYNRLVRFNEIVAPAARNKYQARLEALGEKEKGIFGKGIEWGSNRYKQFADSLGGNTNARLALAIATTTLIGTGIAVTAGSVGAAGGALALAGWGGMRIARVFASGTMGTLFGQLAGLSYIGYAEHVGIKGAEEKLTTVGRSSAEIVTIDDLLEADKAREKLHERSDMNWHLKRAAWITAGVAFLSGAGTAAAIEAFGADAPTPPTGREPGAGAPRPETVVPTDVSDTNGEAQVPAEEVKGAKGPAPAEGASAATTGVAEAASAESVQMAVGATIHEAGQGTDLLFADLQDRVAERGLWPASEQTPALKTLLESSPNELSRMVGESAYGQQGMVMNMGDMFFVDEQQNVWFSPTDGEPTIFIENTPAVEGGVTIHELGTGETSTPTVPVPESAPAAEVQDAAPVPAVESAAPAQPTPEPVIESAQEDAAPAEQAPDVEESVPPAEEAVPVEAAPAVEETMPEVIESNSPEVAGEVNSHGVEIDTTRPQLYISRDGNGVPTQYIYGGTSEEIMSSAQQYLQANPGSEVQIRLPETNPATGAETYRVTVLSSSADGRIVIPDLSLEYPDFTPDSFTEKGDITTRTQ